MPLPKAIRDSLFPFGKRGRKSLDSMASSGHSDSIRSPSQNVSVASVMPMPQQGYMSGYPEQYTPNVGPMQIPGHDYQPHDSGEMQPTFQSSRQETIGDFRLADEAGPASGVRYEDSLMDQDFFEQQLSMLRGSGPGPTSPFFEDGVDAHELVDRQQAAIEPGSSEDPIAPDYFERQVQILEEQFQEHESARFDEFAQMDALFTSQGSLFDLPQAEPINLEQTVMAEEMHDMDQPYEPELLTLHDNTMPLEAFFDGQEMAFEPPQADFSPLEQAVLDESVELMDPLSDPMAQDMDYALQPYGNPSQEMMPDAGAYADEPMAQDTMQGAADPMGPGPQQYDNGIIPQDMYGPPMEEMYDPVMQEMMDPYMMPGHFGPGPGGP